MTQATLIPVSSPVPVLSLSPLSLSLPGRAAPLQLKVSAPISGTALPILLLSHGHGGSNHLSSLDGYGPLAHFWAAHGFVVMQPTHLDSKTLALGPNTPGYPLFWRSCVQDLTALLDHLPEIEERVPGLKGRLDPTRIAVAGHSAGGQTAGMVLGARLTDPLDAAATNVDLKDDRVMAGVLLAAPGHGGSDLSTQAAQRYSFLNPDFSTMAASTLVVMGDRDVSSHLTTRNADWHADPYTLSPGLPHAGPKSLLTVFGGEHGLGGIAGYDAAETTDESPERVEFVGRMTWAYLQTALHLRKGAWSAATAALTAMNRPLGQVHSK